ncbi:MAG: hypothetical protein KGO93_00300 [Cyanobacteria bacterium REEB446]|jgi:hypothetical protein|nr:hypothetical protein [Cyanobacteria bacterium REEB446]
MAKFGADILNTLKRIFPVFSKVHREKRFNHESANSFVGSIREEEDSSDKSRFVSSKLKKSHIISYYESTPDGSKLMEGICLNRSFIEEAVNALKQDRDDLIWFLVNEQGELQYDPDGDLIIFKSGDGTVLSDEQRECQKVRLGLYESKIMIQGANLGNFEWDKTYLFSFADTGELESIRPIGNNFSI